MVKDQWNTLSPTLVVSAPGVLANDGDAEGSVLTAALRTGAQNGQLTMPNGSCTDTPNTGSTGADSFTHEASDGLAVRDDGDRVPSNVSPPRRTRGRSPSPSRLRRRRPPA